MTHSRNYLMVIVLLFMPLAVLAQSYSTNCSGTENPISESSAWKNGSQAGGNLWGNVRKGGGICFGDTEPTAFGDPTAILTDSSWTSTQAAFGIVSGSASGTGEVEVTLRSVISANSIAKYELLCSVVSANPYIQLVKWNGPNGSFAYIARYLAGNVSSSGGEPILCSPGDWFGMDVSGPAGSTVFHVYKNGHLLQMNLENGTGNVTTIPDPGTALTAGSPGIGFYDGGGSFANWGLSYFAAGQRLAKSCAQADVSAAVTAASAGDTILIPPCSETDWTTTLSVNKCVNLKGAGQGVTILGDNVSKTGSPSQLINYTPNCASGSIALSNMTIVSVMNDANNNNLGHVYIGGGYNTLGSYHFHHITVQNPKTSFLRISNSAPGLIDHITENNCGTAGGSTSVGAGSINIEWPNYANSNYGDGSWAEADSTLMGSSNAVFVEDNTFNCSSNPNDSNMVDGYMGARWVVRFNTFGYANTTAHGVDSGGRNRAIRWQEIYKNTYTMPAGTATDFIMWFRGGTGLVWGNTVTSPWINAMAKFDYQRSTQSFAPWGQCNGTGPYDQNSDGSGYRCVDQGGAGQSANLGGNVTPIVANNALLPAYVFNNTLNGSTNNSTEGADARISQNRDFYVYTSSFNGTSGVGSGTLASRPSTCTAGVSYWATDQGTWNTSGSGGQGVLYKCTSTNTWSLYYTPYTYPHPMQSGGSSPAPPSNLRQVGSGRTLGAGHSVN